MMEVYPWFLYHINFWKTDCTISVFRSFSTWIMHSRTPQKHRATITIFTSTTIYKAKMPSVCLSVQPYFLARRYLSSVSINRNKTCSKSKLCLWGSRSFFLQAVRKRLKSRQPLTIKHEASGSSPTLHILLFQWNVFSYYTIMAQLVNLSSTLSVSIKTGLFSSK